MNAAHTRANHGETTRGCRLRIGVTGHRNVPTDPILAERIADTLARIRELAQEDTDGPIAFTAVSALAEGADRLVARTILRQPGGELHAILPLARADYATDFAEVASHAAFLALLDAAHRVSILPPAENRDAAYEAGGRRVVQEADALIALWDGLPARGRGGTAEIVTHARERGLPLFWLVPSAPYPLWEELGDGLPPCTAART